LYHKPSSHPEGFFLSSLWNRGLLGEPVKPITMASGGRPNFSSEEIPPAK